MKPFLALAGILGVGIFLFHAEVIFHDPKPLCTTTLTEFESRITCPESHEQERARNLCKKATEQWKLERQLEKLCPSAVPTVKPAHLLLPVIPMDPDDPGCLELQDRWRNKRVSPYTTTTNL